MLKLEFFEKKLKDRIQETGGATQKAKVQGKKAFLIGFTGFVQIRSTPDKNKRCILGVLLRLRSGRRRWPKKTV